MKLLMENWRQYLQEDLDDEPGKGGTSSQVEALRRAYKILDSMRPGEYFGNTALKNEPWLKDLKALLQDRINRVEAGKLGAPPPRTGKDILRMGSRIISRFKKYTQTLLALAAQANAPLQENDGEDKNFGRAKKGLLRAIDRVLRKIHIRSLDQRGLRSGGSDLLLILKDMLETIEAAEEMEDITFLREEFISTMEELFPLAAPNSSGSRRANMVATLRQAWDRFSQQAAGGLDEDLLGNIPDRLRKVINILRSPALDGVYLDDIRELLFDLWSLLTSEDERIHSEF